MIDIILHGSIDPVKYKARVLDGILNLIVFKTIQEPWTTLAANRVMDIDTRRALDAEVTVREVRNSKDKMNRKVEEERYTLRKQMSIDEEARNRLSELKEAAKREAEESIYSSFENLQQTDSKATAHTVPSPQSQDIAQQGPARCIEDDSSVCEDTEQVGEQSLTPIEDRLISKTSVHHTHVFPRRCSTVRVPIHFSPREFPTPLRESKVAEEQDWLAKNKKHLHKHAVFARNISRVDDKNGSGDDEDPLWLKAKGDDFYRHGDLLSAINAYTSSLDAFCTEFDWKLGDVSLNCTDPPHWLLDHVFLSSLANRANCYFQTQRYKECAADCQGAINIVKTHFRCDMSMNTQCPVAVVSRLLIISSIRLALCHCALLAFDESVCCYERAIILLHSMSGHSITASAESGGNIADTNAAVATHDSIGTEYCLSGLTDDERTKCLSDWSLLRFDLIELDLRTSIREAFPISVLSHELSLVRTLARAKQLKSAADQTLARDGDPEKALCLYNESISLLPYYTSALLNRATCRLSVCDFIGCVEDCSTALLLLGHRDGDSAHRLANDDDSKIAINIPGANADDHDGGILRDDVSSTEMGPTVHTDTHPALSMYARHRASINAEVSAANSASVIFESVVPRLGSKQHTESSTYALCKRGMAWLKLQRCERALSDYQSALTLDPKNEALGRDCERLSLLLLNA